jgi:hypothetical protein
VYVIGLRCREAPHRVLLAQKRSAVCRDAAAQRASRRHSRCEAGEWPFAETDVGRLHREHCVVDVHALLGRLAVDDAMSVD